MAENSGFLLSYTNSEGPVAEVETTVLSLEYRDLSGRMN